MSARRVRRVGVRPGLCHARPAGTFGKTDRRRATFKFRGGIASCSSRAAGRPFTTPTSVNQKRAGSADLRIGRAATIQPGFDRQLRRQHSIALIPSADLCSPPACSPVDPDKTSRRLQHQRRAQATPVRGGRSSRFRPPRFRDGLCIEMHAESVDCRQNGPMADPSARAPRKSAPGRRERSRRDARYDANRAAHRYRDAPSFLPRDGIRRQCRREPHRTCPSAPTRDGLQKSSPLRGC